MNHEVVEDEQHQIFMTSANSMSASTLGNSQYKKKGNVLNDKQSKAYHKEINV